MPTVVQYPEDLGTSVDLLHYVMFFINVRSTQITQLPGTARTGVSVVPGGAGGPAPGAIGDSPISYLVGSAAGAFSPELAGTNQTYRLDTAIALHLDEKPTVQYNAMYDDVDLNGLGQLAKLMSGPGSVQENMQNNWSKDHFAGFMARLATVPLQIFGGSRELSAIAKVRLNPYRQAFFNHMDFRTFTFRYRFMPKSPGEADSIKQIIDLFKFHMHPELSSSTAFMIYPSEFDIMYFYAGAENRYWHRISTCVLQGLNVEYGGEQFTSFFGGVPAEVYMTLTFREIEPLTKERILQGY